MQDSTGPSTPPPPTPTPTPTPPIPVYVILYENEDDPNIPFDIMSVHRTREEARRVVHAIRVYETQAHDIEADDNDPDYFLAFSINKFTTGLHYGPYRFADRRTNSRILGYLAGCDPPQLHDDDSESDLDYDETTTEDDDDDEDEDCTSDDYTEEYDTEEGEEEQQQQQGNTDGTVG
jgi:hypothetical protein